MTSTVGAALASLHCSEGEALALDRITATALVEQFGSPLYAYAQSALQERVQAVRAALPAAIEVLYSIKANPALAICAQLATAGLGAEIASLGELHLARAAGFAVQALRYAGPGKSEAELRTAIDVGLGTFHVESLDELGALARLATAANRRVRIALRMNLATELPGARMRMGGSSSRFGIDEEQIPTAITEVVRNPYLDLAGLHVYSGTQCFDAQAFVTQAQHIAEIAANLERLCCVDLPEIDLGGGFGVALFEGDPTFDLAIAASGLQQLVQAPRRSQRRWFIELGRFLTAPCGVYLTRVVATKDSGGVRHVALDGGLHHCAAAAGLGTVLKRAPLVVAAAPTRGPLREQVLGGPLCTPLDQFGTCTLPELRLGDVVAVLHAGAYGLTYSPQGFLSHPTPAEVLVNGGQARVIRERGKPEAVLLGQHR